MNVFWQRPAEGERCQKKRLPLINLYIQYELVYISLQQMHKKAVINVIALKYILFVTASKYKSAYSGHLSAGYLPSLLVSVLWRPFSWARGAVCAGLHLLLCFSSPISNMPSHSNEWACSRMQVWEPCDGRWFIMPGCQCDSLRKPLRVGQSAGTARQCQAEDRKVPALLWGMALPGHSSSVSLPTWRAKSDLGIWTSSMSRV